MSAVIANLGYLWFVMALVAATAALVSRRWSLLVLAASCVSVAMIWAFYPITFITQLAFAFAVLLLGGGVYFRTWRAPVPETATSRTPKKLQKIVGARVSLIHPVKAGKSKAQINRAVWTVRCDKALAAGSLVQVIGWHGRELEVTPVAQQSAQAG